MGRRIAVLMTLLGATMLVAWAPLAPLAGATGGTPPLPHRLSPALSAPPGLAAGSQRLTVMVELAASPAISGRTPAEITLRSQQIAVAQLTLAQRLAALHAQVLFQTRL